jgi:hypothetical protein
MSTTPTPPAGYKLENVPDFLKPTAEQSKVVVQPPNNKDIAVVHSSTPTEVDVNEPTQFNQPDLNHEETHVFQFSRNPEVVQQMESDLQTGKLPKTYTYGGPDGLLQAQQQHKTIADFGPEQQAEMVKDYQAGTQEALAKNDAAKLDKLNAAYGPFVRQLSNLPSKNESMTTMTQKDLTPPEPGLPPAEETGILAENKLMGSDEKVLKNPPKLPSSNLITQSYQGKAVPGIVEPGNLDITKRPNIDNHDGTHSSTFSISFGTDKGEVLVPGVGDGKNYPLRKLTPKEALDQYHKTGGNFGTFKTIKDANTYAEKLHEDQATYGNRPKLPKGYKLEAPQ